MKQKLLLTGASSFLGRSIAEQMSGNYHILKTSRHSVESKSIVAMDLTKKDQIEMVFQEFKPDIIIHAGALVNLSRDTEIGVECLMTNALGTYNLLDVASKNQISKYIFISSEEVYGNGEIPFQETQMVLPPSPYAISKAAGEYYSIYFSSEYNIPTVILRLGTFYGPGQPKSKYFFQVIQEAILGNEVQTNLAQKKRDYIYIDDVIKAIQKSIDYSLKGWDIFNITGGVSISLEKVLELILKFTKSNSKIKFGALPERKTEREIWLADLSKAKKILKWEPLISLDEGLRRMVKYVSSI